MNEKLLRLDAAVKDKEDRLKEMRETLDKVVKPVQAIDLRIEQQLKVIAKLEEEKQKALEKVRDAFELAIVNGHTLSNGYKVQFHGKRPIKVTNIKAFLGWLKVNVPAEEVATFLGAAIGSKELKKFVENYCDDMKLKGVIVPSIDGINLEEINFRRLRTSLTKQERK